MVSFFKHYKLHQIGMPPPSGQSCHHQLPLVVPYSTSSLWGFFTFPTSHPDSFHSFILGAGSLSPNLLSHFRFGQIWSETKTADRRGELLRPLTRSCFFVLLLGRLFLLALPLLLGVCLRSRWSLPFSFHDPALIPLFLAKLQLLPTLTLSPLTIWYFKQIALFVFLLARAALAYLPTALSVALRPLFPFQWAQYAQAFLLKPAAFCVRFAGLGSTNKSVTFLLVSSFPSFLLPQSLWQIWQKLYSLSSCSIRLQWVPGHSFFPGNNTANELARQGALLAPSAIPCSLILSLVSTLVFSRLEVYCLIEVLLHTGSLNFYRGTSAHCVLCRFYCHEHCLLLSSYRCRVGRIENPSCSACEHPSQDISHLILHCPAMDSALLALWRLSVSLRSLVQVLGSCPASGAPWLSAMPPSLGKGRVTTTSTTRKG